MKQEWKELKTFQEVATAQAAGEEIWVSSDDGVIYSKWNELYWSSLYKFRSRPRKKVKQIVLRECLRHNPSIGYYTDWREYVDISSLGWAFVKWLDTPERVIEVEE